MNRKLNYGDTREPGREEDPPVRLIRSLGPVSVIGYKLSVISVDEVAGYQRLCLADDRQLITHN